MKKVIGAIVKIVLGLVCLVVVASVLLIVFFPVEKARKLAEEQLSKMLHREVVVSKLSINLLKGIVIQDVRISNRSTFKQGPFVECKAFYVKYDLLKLLQKRFVMEGLVLDSPSIYVQRYIGPDKKAVFNFSDLLLKKKPQAAEQEAEEPQEEESAAEPEVAEKTSPGFSSGRIPINIQVKEIGLKNAKIEFTDTATRGFKEVYSLHSVRMLVSDIDIKNNTPLKLDTGFGLAVSEFKAGRKTDKDVNLDVNLTGVFILFDAASLLNPEGVMDLQLANGKFHGIQLYQELQNQGRKISEDADSYRSGTLQKIADLKKSVAAAQQNPALGKYLGSAGSTVEKVNALAQKLDKVDTGFISRGLDIGFLKEDLQFDRMDAVVLIRDKRVISTNIEMKGKEMDATAAGSVGFDQTLDWLVNLMGDKKYADNILTQSLLTPEGKVLLPVAITGTVSKPVVRPMVDYKALMAKEIEKLLGPEAGSIVSGNTSVKDMAKEAVNQQADKLKTEAQQQIDQQKDKAVDTVKDKAQDALKKKLPGLKF